MDRTPSSRTARRPGGFTLVETVVAVAVLVLASLALVGAYSSSTIASHRSDRAVAVRTSLETTFETVSDVPYEQILAWNGIQIDRGDHTVTVAANLVQVGLIVCELIVTDDQSGAVLASLATYRSGET